MLYNVYIFLVNYIYTGEVSVSGPCLSSFLSLAHSLGIAGFTDPLQPSTPTATAENKTPTKRKLEWGAPPPPPLTDSKVAAAATAAVQLEGLKSEALRLLSSLPATPVKKAGSEPASLAETVLLQCSASKKRKLQTQSLTDNIENISPNLFMMPQQRVSLGNDGNQQQRSGGGGVTGVMMLPPSRPPLSSMGPPPPPPYVTPGGSARSSYPSSPSRDHHQLGPNFGGGLGPLHAPSTSCPVPPSPAYSNNGGGTTASAAAHTSGSNFRYVPHM